MNLSFSKTIQFILRDILKEMQYLPLAILWGTVLYLVTILCTRRYKKPIFSTTFIIYFIMLWNPCSIKMEAVKEYFCLHIPGILLELRYRNNTVDYRARSLPGR